MDTFLNQKCCYYRNLIKSFMFEIPYHIPKRAFQVVLPALELLLLLSPGYCPNLLEVSPPSISAPHHTVVGCLLVHATTF